MLFALNLIAAAVVLLYSFLALATMDHKTCHFVRSAYIVLSVGAFFVLVEPLYGYVQPQFSETLFNIGMALLLAANKRSYFATS